MAVDVTTPEEFLHLLPDDVSSRFFLPYLEKSYRRHSAMSLKQIIIEKSQTLSGVAWNKHQCSFPIPLVVFSCDQAALQMVFSVRLSVCPSVRLSVCLSHLFHHVPIIVSTWNFQELLPWSKVMSMQKVKVRGQRSRSQRSRPNLTVSGL